VLAALRPRAASGGRPRRSPDQVAALAGLALDTVLSVLLELEIAGKVERLRGPAYRLVKRNARGRREDRELDVEPGVLVVPLLVRRRAQIAHMAVKDVVERAE